MSKRNDNNHLQHKPTLCHIITNACYSGGTELYILQRITLLSEYKHCLIFFQSYEDSYIEHFDSVFRSVNKTLEPIYGEPETFESVLCSISYNIKDEINRAHQIAAGFHAPCLYSLHDYSVISVGPGYNRLTLKKNKHPIKQAFYLPLERDASSRKPVFFTHRHLSHRLQDISRFDAFETPSNCLNRDLSSILPGKPIYTNTPFSYSESIEHSSPSKRNILFIGGLFRGKGIKFLVSALHQLNTPFSITIVGKGYLKPTLHKMHLNKLISLEFHESLTQDQLKKHYLDSTVVVVPSILESFGMVALEAMSHSRTVVAFNHSGLAEIVDHRNTGFLAAPFSTSELASYIDELLTNSTHRHEMERAAFARAQDTYSKKHSYQSTMKMLSEVCTAS